MPTAVFVVVACACLTVAILNYRDGHWGIASINAVLGVLNAIV